MPRVNLGRNVSQGATSPSTDVAEHVGRYRLVRQIARGGMAEVFAATQLGAHGFAKRVVIKRILAEYSDDAQFLRMMLDEARINMWLAHPNIAQVLDFGEERGRYFLVMEYVAGQSLGTLWKHLRSVGERLGVLESCYVASQVLDGLQAAHEQRDDKGRPAQIIHRDVSPQNILLSYDGNVKLIDFGIARARDRLERTTVGTIKGKLRYLAPEMIDPAAFGVKQDYDHRVDVFAAGVVLFELLSGRNLFSGADELSVYRQITEEPIPDLVAEGACDDALMEIVRRALERRAIRRYPTAEDFASALRAYMYRHDPGFHHRRIVEVLERHFPSELTERRRWEGGEEGPDGAPNADLALRTKLHSSADSAAPARPVAPKSASVSSGQTSVSTPASYAGAVRRVAATDETAAFLAAPQPLVGAGETPVSEERLEGEANADEFEPSPAASHAASHAPVLVDAPQGRGRLAGAPLVVGLALVVGAGLVGWRALLGPTRDAIEETTKLPLSEGLRVPLIVTSTPPETRVSCFGCVSDAPVEVPAVFHVPIDTEVEIEAVAPGYGSLRQRVRARDADAPQRLELALRPLPVAVELRVHPAGALVTLGGRPYAADTVVVPLVPIRVEVDAPGYLPWADTVTPAVGETWRLEVALERLPPLPKTTAPVQHEKPRPPASSKGLAVGHGELVISVLSRRRR
ncbi:MAG: serine/threonine-protein kinase [Myxococcota bacterium]